jgi:hypothetical protein
MLSTFAESITEIVPPGVVELLDELCALLVVVVVLLRVFMRVRHGKRGKSKRKAPDSDRG